MGPFREALTGRCALGLDRTRLAQHDQADQSEMDGVLLDCASSKARQVERLLCDDHAKMGKIREEKRWLRLRWRHQSRLETSDDQQIVERGSLM